MNTTKEEIIKKINELPKVDSAQYTVLLRNLVINFPIDVVETQLKGIIENTELDIDIRFGAYYASSIFFRRLEHTTKFISLVDIYSQIFNKYSLNKVVLSLYYKYKALSSDLQFFNTAIEYANLAANDLPENSGVLQNYSDLVVTALDEGLPISDQEINKALRFIDHALLIIPNYPKYYCTKGRLLYWKKEIKGAIFNIRKAIDLENKDNKDSMIRIGQYYYFLLNIKTSDLIENIDLHVKKNEQGANEIYSKNVKKTEEIFLELDKMKSKYLEFLAFFSSILAFIISTINIISTFGNFNNAAGLLIILGGALSFSFCIFRMIILYNTEKRGIIKTILAIILSITMIIAGLLIGNQ